MPNKNREAYLAYQRQYAFKHREKNRLRAAKWYDENREYGRAMRRKRTKKIRYEIIKHYSNNTMSCAMCSTTDESVLTVDHINGGGVAHIKNLRKLGIGFYHWLFSNNFPLGFKILCMNCQFIKEANMRKVTKQKKWYLKAKSKVIVGYGGCCTGCGDDDTRCLSLDHINNDGAYHRRVMRWRGGTGTWYWALKNRFPRMLQLLCMNCQMRKRKGVSI